MEAKKIDDAAAGNQNSANHNSAAASFSEETLKLAQCLMPVPPTAKIRRLVDTAAVEVEKELSELAWKAYDSIVGLANRTTNQVFSNQRVGQALGGSIDLMLRWQRFNHAVAGALFSALWPAVGLPTGSEVAAVRADIRGLREELRAAVAEAETNEDYARELHEAVRHSMVNGPDSAHERKSSARQIAVWSGWAGGEHMEIKDVGN